MKCVVNWIPLRIRICSRNTQPHLNVGLFLFEQTCEFAGIQFTKHFIKFVFVETNQLFNSNSKVILTRQTCAHHCSSRVAGSKRRELALYFSVRIWCIFSLLKSRGKSDLGVYMTSVLSKRMQQCNADFWRILRTNTFLNRKSALCGHILFASTKVMHT